MSVDRVQGLRKIVNQAKKSLPPSPCHAVYTLTLNLQDCFTLNPLSSVLSGMIISSHLSLFQFHVSRCQVLRFLNGS
jgi:hypothetical protein